VSVRDRHWRRSASARGSLRPPAGRRRSSGSADQAFRSSPLSPARAAAATSPSWRRGRKAFPRSGGRRLRGSAAPPCPPVSSPISGWRAQPEHRGEQKKHQTSSRMPPIGIDFIPAARATSRSPIYRHEGMIDEACRRIYASCLDPASRSGARPRRHASRSLYFISAADCQAWQPHAGRCTLAAPHPRPSRRSRPVFFFGFSGGRPGPSTAVLGQLATLAGMEPAIVVE